MASLSLANILELGLADRLRLVQAIWDSIAETPDAVPLTDQERLELDRRLAAYEQSPDAGSPWADVKARLTRGK